MADVRDLIRRRLADMGLSMKEASERIGRNHAYLQQYFERGVPASEGATTLELSGARQVWVRTTEGTVRAGLSLSLNAAGADPLFALVPLPPAQVSATQVPVRQIPG